VLYQAEEGVDAAVEDFGGVVKRRGVEPESDEGEEEDGAERKSTGKGKKDKKSKKGKKLGKVSAGAGGEGGWGV
jgi:hypothetical protein